ncbi:MAG TPA: hypothetical protein VNQ90_09090 [Chthoniobacteraceae bacterium]|nr:hypothetical protein [Chthoniobacteraceae bacterium]
MSHSCRPLLLLLLFLTTACRPQALQRTDAPIDATAIRDDTPLLYVSPTGGDDAEGTATAPLGTLAEAIRRAEAAPGTVIRLKPGTFRERVKITTHATAQQPLIIEGARNASGEWLSIVDGSHALDPSLWKLRNDLGPGVYAYPGETPRLILVNDKMVAHLDRRALERQPLEEGASRRTVGEILAWPEDYLHTYRYHPIPFWQTLGGIYTSAQDQKEFYLRLAGGVNPATRPVAVASEGGTITIDGGQHIILRHLLIKGGQHGVEIGGEGAADNLVEGCYIPHGRRRINLAEGATRTVIRGNRLEMGFIGNPTGAWALGYDQDGSVTEEEKLDAAKKAFVYNYFKYWASPVQTSDDVSILIGADTRQTRVEENLLDGGLIGISLRNTSDVEIIGNTIRHFSSVGTAAGMGSYRAVYDGNLFSDCSINLRLHSLNTPGRREIYLLRNTSILPKGRGTHLFCHFFRETERTPDHFIAVYHNTFLGGVRGLWLPPAKRPEQALHGFQVVNNQFIDCGTFLVPREAATHDRAMFGHFDHNRIAASHFSKSGKPVWFGSHNVMSDDAPGWHWDALTFQAPADDPGRHTGIDLSHPYQLDDKSYPPLPGLKPGYFHGKRPNPGVPANLRTASHDLP